MSPSDFALAGGQAGGLPVSRVFPHFAGCFPSGLGNHRRPVARPSSAAASACCAACGSAWIDSRSFLGQLPCFPGLASASPSAACLPIFINGLCDLLCGLLQRFACVPVALRRQLSWFAGFDRFLSLGGLLLRPRRALRRLRGDCAFGKAVALPWPVRQTFACAWESGSPAGLSAAACASGLCGFLRLFERLLRLLSGGFPPAACCRRQVAWQLPRQRPGLSFRASAASAWPCLLGLLRQVTCLLGGPFVARPQRPRGVFALPSANSSAASSAAACCCWASPICLASSWAWAATSLPSARFAVQPGPPRPCQQPAANSAKLLRGIHFVRDVLKRCFHRLAGGFGFLAVARRRLAPIPRRPSPNFLTQTPLAASASCWAASSACSAALGGVLPGGCFVAFSLSGLGSFNVLLGCFDRLEGFGQRLGNLPARYSPDLRRFHESLRRPSPVP